MNMCSRNHDDIVYDSYDCPLCEKIKASEEEATAFEKTVDELNEIIEKLKDEIVELNNREDQ